MNHTYSYLPTIHQPHYDAKPKTHQFFHKQHSYPLAKNDHQLYPVHSIDLHSYNDPTHNPARNIRHRWRMETVTRKHRNFRDAYATPTQRQSNYVR